MSQTSSTMLPLGTPVPYFDLPDAEGNHYNLDRFAEARALLIIFMCNHCPYVAHVRKKMVELITEYQKKGVAVVGITSNDTSVYQEDGPVRMVEDGLRYFYTFPYLIDEDQTVAKSFHAACTPDFFLFDKDRKLAYRGQMDDSRPGNGIPVSGKDLRAALDATLENRPAAANQKPSMGCNIKWKKGNEPEYFHVIG